MSSVGWEAQPAKMSGSAFGGEGATISAMKRKDIKKVKNPDYDAANADDEPEFVYKIKSKPMQRPFGPLRIWKFLKRGPATALIQKKAEKAMRRRLSAGCRVEMKAEKQEKMVAAIANAMKAMKAMKAMQRRMKAEEVKMVAAIANALKAMKAKKAVKAMKAMKR